MSFGQGVDLAGSNGWSLPDEGYETHGLLLGGGFNYLGSDGSRCRWDNGNIDGEVLYEGGEITGIMIIRRDR